MIDQQNARHLVQAEFELFDQHERGEDHTDLPSRAIEERQGVVKPVARLQNNLAALRLSLFEMRIRRPGDNRQQRRGQSAEQIELDIGRTARPNIRMRESFGKV